MGVSLVASFLVKSFSLAGRAEIGAIAQSRLTEMGNESLRQDHSGV